MKELLNAAKSYRAAVNAEFAAKAKWNERKDQASALAVADAMCDVEDATMNLLEVAGRVG